MGLDFNQLKEKTKSEFFRYARVWNLLKKPSMKEFKTIAGVSALGVLIIGAIGFIISTIIRPFFQ
jgi:protein transport protein SEC61 subunit gamma-like protein